MNYSYWELKEWFTNIDFTIVGSGIVGLNCALELKKKFPKAKIIILEKGMLPQGASTKNAGFACFGSISEIIDDLNSHTEQEVFNLVDKRWKGLQLLRNNLGDANINFQQNKGFEFTLTHPEVPMRKLLTAATLGLAALAGPAAQASRTGDFDVKKDYKKRFLSPPVFSM
jgi:hypothetical protein